MHVLQRLPLANLIFVLPRNGLGVIDPMLEKKQLSTGGVQLSLRHD